MHRLPLLLLLGLLLAGSVAPARLVPKRVSVLEQAFSDIPGLMGPDCPRRAPLLRIVLSHPSFPGAEQ